MHANALSLQHASAAFKQTTQMPAYPSIYLVHAFVSTSNPMVAAGWNKLCKARDVASKLPAIC